MNVRRRNEGVQMDFSPFCAQKKGGSLGRLDRLAPRFNKTHISKSGLLGHATQMWYSIVGVAGQKSGSGCLTVSPLSPIRFAIDDTLFGCRSHCIKAQ